MIAYVLAHLPVIIAGMIVLLLVAYLAWLYRTTYTSPPETPETPAPTAPPAAPEVAMDEAVPEDTRAMKKAFYRHMKNRARQIDDHGKLIEAMGRKVDSLCGLMAQLLKGEQIMSKEMNDLKDQIAQTKGVVQ